MGRPVHSSLVHVSDTIESKQNLGKGCWGEGKLQVKEGTKKKSTEREGPCWFCGAKMKCCRADEIKDGRSGCKYGMGKMGEHTCAKPNDDPRYVNQVQTP